MTGEEVSKLLETLEELDQVAIKIGNYQNAINNCENKIRRLKSKKVVILASIIFVLLAFLLFCPVSIITTIIVRSLFPNSDYMQPISGLIAGTLVSVGLIIIGIAIDVISNIVRKRKIAAELDEATKENERLLNEFQFLLTENEEKIKIVPKGYFYPMAIEYFIEVFGNGRAESWKNAMDLFEEQVHRWRIEDMTRASMVAQQQTAMNSAVIRANTAISASANVATAISSILK